MTKETARIIAFAENEKYRKELEPLARRLGLAFTDEAPDKDGAGAANLPSALTPDPAVDPAPVLTLCLDESGLSLRGNGLSLRGDFTQLLPRLRPGNLQGELLVRAARIKNAGGPLTAVDATAGLGEDSFLLAAAGFSVLLFEYNPIIAALLQDALRRARECPALAEAAGRLTACEADSITALGKLTAPPDLIFLDPMFPARHKSALVKKKFQLLQLLEQPCSSETELMQAAVNAHPRKLVIKRPSKGPFLAGIKPGYSIQGKGIRYDCHIFNFT